MVNLDRLRDRMELFAEDLAAEEYRLAESPAHRPQLGALYRRNSGLFELERISEVQRAVSESTGEEDRRARCLLEYLVAGRSACAAPDELDERLSFLRAGMFQVGERQISVRRLGSVLEIADLGARRMVGEQYFEALSDEEPVFHDLLRRRRGVYEELGYGAAVEAMEIISGIDLRGLERDASRFLDDTQAAYTDLLAWHLPRHSGVAVGEANSIDLQAVQVPEAVRREFSSRNPLRTFRAVFEQAQLDLAAEGRLKVESRVELGGGATAKCRPLRIPWSVVLLDTATTRPEAHASTLRSLGRALFCAYTDGSLPLEFRWFGDRSVYLAAGLLFENLLQTQPFLRDAYRLPAEQIQQWQRFITFRLLQRSRVDAALLRLAMEWASGADDETVRSAGVELLGRATGVRHDPRGVFAQLALPTEIARRLRGQQLAASLLCWMRDRFDEDWYRNPRGGAQLRSMFSEGYRFTAAERGYQLASAPLSFEAAARCVSQVTG
jgi:hypothetical protein